MDWCNRNSLIESNDKAVFSLTVVETKVKHIKPARYADLLTIQTRTRTEGVRLFFQYRIWAGEKIVCLAETVHCNLDLNFKVKRLNSELIKLVEKDIWTETWL